MAEETVKNQTLAEAFSPTGKNKQPKPNVKPPSAGNKSPSATNKPSAKKYPIILSDMVWFEA